MLVDELAQALRHLSAPDVLGSLPLAQRMSHVQDSTGTRGAGLRVMLLAAIEHLRPEEAINLDSPEWRIYTILRDRYVFRHSPPQVERQLNLGDRQVRREHRRALAVLAALLEPQFSVRAAPVAETPDSGESIREAVHRLMPAPRPFGLGSLFDDVAGVAVAAAGDAAAPKWSVSPANQTVFTDRGILSQLLLKLMLTHRTQAEPTVVTTLHARADSGKVRVTITGPGLRDPSQERQLMYMLADVLGTTIVMTPELGRAEFDLPAGGALHSVLVVDDEPMAVELLRTHLSGTEFDLKFETTPETAIQTALALKPDVIVLDVMMPAMDGWALLQRLRSLPQTQRIPILVYSVLEETALAEALGATRFLRKPVGRARWLTVLREIVR